MQKKSLLWSAAVVAGLWVGIAFAAGPQPIPVLILSGQNNHAWKETTPFLQKILEETGRFSVAVTNHPETLNAERLKPYAAVISNWNAFGTGTEASLVTEWPAEARKAVLDFVRSGKGHIVIHAGGSSFYDWPDYQKMVGGASWKMGKTSHGPRHDFSVRKTKHPHPITAKTASFEIHDELWNATGLNPNAEILAEAFSAKDHGGTDRWEPVAAVNPYGKGRNFSLLLGHDTMAMNNPGFRNLFHRGTEWAATGRIGSPSTNQ